MNEGLQLGLDMAELAAKHAGEQWKADAYQAFVAYARKNKRFTTEQVRKANPDFPPAPDQRAWGAIAKQAERDDIVSSAGWTRAKSKTVHGMVVTLWESQLI